MFTLSQWLWTFAKIWSKAGPLKFQTGFGEMVRWFERSFLPVNITKLIHMRIGHPDEFGVNSEVSAHLCISACGKDLRVMLSSLLRIYRHGLRLGAEDFGSHRSVVRSTVSAGRQCYIPQTFSQIAVWTTNNIPLQGCRSKRMEEFDVSSSD